MTKCDICIYCNARPGNTNDHVPPKSILIKPYPDNLPTVPCCHECNHGFSKEMDLNFKLYIAKMLYDNQSSAVEIRTFLDGVGRTLQKNKVALRNLIRDISAYDQETDKLLIRIRESERVAHRAALERIVKGLFYYQFKRIIPSDFIIEVYDLIKTPIGSIFHTIGVKSKIYSINEAVFYVEFEELPECKGASLWELHFYGSYIVRVFTGPQDLFNGITRG